MTYANILCVWQWSHVIVKELNFHITVTVAIIISLFTCQWTSCCQSTTHSVVYSTEYLTIVLLLLVYLPNIILVCTFSSRFTVQRYVLFPGGSLLYLWFTVSRDCIKKPYDVTRLHSPGLWAHTLTAAGLLNISQNVWLWFWDETCQFSCLCEHVCEFVCVCVFLSDCVWVYIHVYAGVHRGLKGNP